MKAPLALVLIALLSGPVVAQDKPAEPEDGLSLMERGMKLLFDQMMDDMGPALGEMAEAMKELEPMARDLARMIGDVRNYEAPEQLPNGDIIIRRKPDAPPPPKIGPKVTPTPDGQIEL